MSDLRGSPAEVGSSGLPALAWQWVHAVRGASYVELSADGLHSLLTGLAERLAALLVAEPFDADGAAEVGEALVAVRLASPQVLRRSLAVLAGLPAAAGLAEGQAAGRASAGLSAAAAGFARPFSSGL